MGEPALQDLTQVEFNVVASLVLRVCNSFVCLVAVLGTVLVSGFASMLVPVLVPVLTAALRTGCRGVAMFGAGLVDVPDGDTDPSRDDSKSRWSARGLHCEREDTHGSRAWCATPLGPWCSPGKGLKMTLEQRDEIEGYFTQRNRLTG